MDFLTNALIEEHLEECMEIVNNAPAPTQKKKKNKYI